MPSVASSVSPHHVVEFVSITGARHFPALIIHFSDGLNCLIGGKGAGKTAVLWSICFGLDVPIAPPHEELYAEYQVEAFGPGTVIVVGTRSMHGVAYRWTRKFGEEKPTVTDERGDVVKDVSLGGEFFAVHSFAQGQIEGIARKPAQQLELIDSFAVADVQRIDADVLANDRKLARCDGELGRLEAEIQEDEETHGELASVQEALKGAALGGATASEGSGKSTKEREQAHAAKLERGRERVAMAALSSEIGSARDGLDSFARDALQRIRGVVEGAHERGPHGEVFRGAHAAMLQLSGAIESTASRLRADVAAAERAVSEAATALTVAHAKKDAEHDALVVRDDADRERAAQAARLQKRFEELSAVAKRLADKRRREGALRAEWSALLAERRRLLEEKSAKRKQIALELTSALNGEASLDVVPRGDADAFTALLAEVVQGEKFRGAYIAAIASRIAPDLLVQCIESKNFAPLIEADPLASDKESRAARLADAVTRSGRLRELQRAKLEDQPVLHLRVKKRMKPSSKLSTGQRCSLALAVLLQRSTSVLLIDQAEDSLDNDYIYAVMVEQMKRVRLGRQILIVTHNPNPPSLAHADRIVALDLDDEGLGKLEGQGTFEELCGQVERLEGGRRAFLERGRRYGVLEGEDEDDGETTGRR